MVEQKKSFGDFLVGSGVITVDQFKKVIGELQEVKG